MNFENYSVSELAHKLIPYIGKKAEKKTRKDLLRNDRFVESSSVSQKDFATVENIFFKTFSSTEFVELSPLQPLGLNCFLAGTNGKKIIPTIRGQEVNSDATTALFLEAFKRFDSDQDIDLATNVRTIRPKIFSPESKFLPHFKVFAEVTIGIQGKPFGLNEVLAIRDHLFGELDALCCLCHSAEFDFQSINVGISNVVFMDELLELFVPNYSKTGHKKNDFEQVLKSFGENFLGKHGHLDIDENLPEILKDVGVKKGLKILEMFIDVSSFFFETWTKKHHIHFYFDLTRSAGIDYYRHICYSIVGTNCHGEKISLGDGGSTDWATKLSNNKQLFTVASGIGTEIIIRNFKKPAL